MKRQKDSELAPTLKNAFSQLALLDELREKIAQAKADGNKARLAGLQATFQKEYARQGRMMKRQKDSGIVRAKDSAGFTLLAIVLAYLIAQRAAQNEPDTAGYNLANYQPKRRLL